MLRKFSLVKVFFLVFVTILSTMLAGFGDEKSGSAQAKEKEVQYPSRPIMIIVPYGAGGGTDINARLVASYMEKKLRQPVVVTNKTGGGGAIGTREIAHSNSDGYTLGCLSYPDTAVITAVKGERAGFKNEDLVPLGTFTNTPNILAVKKDGPFKTLQKFIDYAKQNPGKISVSLPSDAHKLGLIEIEDAYGVDLNPVMFKSGSEAMNTLIGGHVMATFCASQFAVPVLDKITVFASAGEKRVGKFMDVPTFKELGHDIINVAMRVFCVPKDVPDPIRKKLTSILAEMQNDKGFVDKVNGCGEIFEARIGADMEKFYRDTNAKIVGTVGKFKEQFEQ